MDYTSCSSGAEVSARGLSTGDPAPSVVGGVYHAPAGSLPPSCNTGVGNTSVLLDWLSFTVSEMAAPLDVVLGWLTPPGRGLSDWVPGERGGMGYRASALRGHVKVFFDGAPGMGTHVVLSGQAMRQIEEEFGLTTEAAWLSWLRMLREAGCRLTRLDPAIDSLNGLDMGVIREAARSVHLVSTFHKARRVTGESWSLVGSGDCDEKKPKGETIYFGSRSSNMFIRIYNKGAEMGLPESESLIRVEMEAKKEGAEHLLTRILEEGFAVLPKILRSYLEFKTPKDGDSNKSRWPVAPWWDEFLGSAEKVRLAVHKAVARSYSDMRDWLYRQAAPSLAVLVDGIQRVYAAKPGRARKKILEELTELVEFGRSRYKSKHVNALEGYSAPLGGLFA